MSRDLDPEQLADLRRARSVGDVYREPRDPATALDTVAVEQWPCRRCTIAMVPVTATAVETLAMSNEHLIKRGEKPIPKSAVVFCARCEPIARAERAEREEKQRAEIRDLTRELFALVDNDLREASIATRLRQLGHANVPALLSQAAARRAEKRRGGPTSNRRSKDL